MNSLILSLPKTALKQSFQYVYLSISNVCMVFISTICINLEILYTKTIGPTPPSLFERDLGRIQRSSLQRGANSTMKVYLY